VSSTSIYSVPTAAGEYSWNTPGVGRVRRAQLANDHLYALVGVDDGLGHCRFALDNGARWRGATLPELCSFFVPNPVEDGWIAACGRETPLDLARYSLDDSLTVLESALLDSGIEVAPAGRVFWQHNNIRHLYDVATGDRWMVDIEDSELVGFDEAYAYVLVDHSPIGRVPLAVEWHESSTTAKPSCLEIHERARVHRCVRCRAGAVFRRTTQTVAGRRTPRTGLPKTRVPGMAGKPGPFLARLRPCRMRPS
jgi:hypothetical protein